MSWEPLVALALLVAILYILGRNLAPPDVTLVGGLTALMSLSAFSDRFPTPREAALAFGNEGLLTVGVLFVIAAGLTETGGIALLTERLLGRPATLLRALVRMIVPVAVTSAFINNTPVVAMFVPVIGEWCKKTRQSPSKLFIPLSYAAILGGVCTLIGTSTNLVVQGMLIEANKTDPSIRPFGMFTITPLGLPVALAGLAYLVVLAPRLLPDRRQPAWNGDETRQYTAELLVRRNSPIVGKTVEDAGLRHLPGAYLMAIQRGAESLAGIGPGQRLLAEDRLVFVGIVDSLVELQNVRGLSPPLEHTYRVNDRREDRCLTEVVVSPRCPLVGKSIREGQFRNRYDAVVLAVHRHGERIQEKIGDIVLKVGDTLLLQTRPWFHRKHRNNGDFFLSSAVPGSRPVRHDRAWIALAIFAALVVAAAFEGSLGLSLLNIGLLAAALMGLTRCCSAEQARRSIDWSTLIAIGAAIGIGRAIESTGLAAIAAAALVDALRPAGPWAVLAGIYLLTLVFTEIVTNNAAAALAFPIALAAARGMGVDFMPFAATVMVAASSGFATPLGYQTHMMVYGPGGYRFGDFVRIGLPLDLLLMIVTVLVTPLVFPF